MKLLTLIFILTFLAVLNVATAGSTSLTDIRRLNTFDSKQLKQSITEVHNALENFDLSKGDIKIREHEAALYMELALKVINVDENGDDIDETGDSEAFLYHTYNSDRVAFDRVLNKMNATKAALIREIIRKAGRALIDGQD